VQHLSAEQYAQVKELEAKLLKAEGESEKSPSHSILSDSTSLDVSLTPAEQYKAELDSLIAAECINCGDIMIDSISLPFVQQKDEAEMRSWFV